MFKLGAFDRRLLKSWIPMAFVISMVMMTVYGGLQQVLRISGNDPQIQMVQDTTAALENGATAQTYSSATPINFATSLAPFTAIYDKNGSVIATSGTLNGSEPVLPRGVFSYTLAHGEDRFTWQPTASVRIAAVLRYYKTSATDYGFVLSGRNLREIEKRENVLLIEVSLAWAITMAGSLGLLLLLTERKASKK